MANAIEVKARYVLDEQQAEKLVRQTMGLSKELGKQMGNIFSKENVQKSFDDMISKLNEGVRKTAGSLGVALEAHGHKDQFLGFFQKLNGEIKTQADLIKMLADKKIKITDVTTVRDLARETKGHEELNKR